MSMFSKFQSSVSSGSGRKSYSLVQLLAGMMIAQSAGKDAKATLMVVLDRPEHGVAAKFLGNVGTYTSGKDGKDKVYNSHSIASFFLSDRANPDSPRVNVEVALRRMFASENVPFVSVEDALVRGINHLIERRAVCSVEIQKVVDNVWAVYSQELSPTGQHAVATTLAAHGLATDEEVALAAAALESVALAE